MFLLPSFATNPGDNSHLINQVHCLEFFELCAQVADSSVDMVLADLPYAVTSLGWDAVIPMEPMWREFRRIIKPRGAIVLTASQPFTSALVSSWAQGFRYEWIWHKTMPTGYLNAFSQPMKGHENILVFGDNPPTYYPQMTEGTPYKAKRGTSAAIYNDKGTDNDNPGTRFPVSVITIPNPNRENTHPTQKPVDLFSYLIRTYTQPGDLVFDPTCGSGTTGLAAQNTGRNFICGDFTHEYVEIARRRLKGLPGKKPEPGTPYTINMFAEYEPEKTG